MGKTENDKLENPDRINDDDARVGAFSVAAPSSGSNTAAANRHCHSTTTNPATTAINSSSSRATLGEAKAKRMARAQAQAAAPKPSGEKDNLDSESDNDTKRQSQVDREVLHNTAILNKVEGQKINAPKFGQDVQVGAVHSTLQPNRQLGESKVKRDFRHATVLEGSSEAITPGGSDRVAKEMESQDPTINSRLPNKGLQLNEAVPCRARDQSHSNSPIPASQQRQRTRAESSNNSLPRKGLRQKSTDEISDNSHSATANFTSTATETREDPSEAISTVAATNNDTTGIEPPNESMTPLFMHQNDVPSNELLVTAQPVSESAPHDGELPVASQFNEEEEIVVREQARQKQAVKMISGLIAMLLLVIVGVVLLTVFLTNTTSDGDQALANSTTMAPTVAPTSSAFFARGLLPPETLFVIDKDSTGETPQSMAFDWLIDDVNVNLGAYSNKKLVQRFALATLYYATNGNGWFPNASQGWLDHELDDCSWGFSQEHHNIFEEMDEIEAYVMPASPCAFSNNHSSITSIAMSEMSEEYRHLWLPEIEMKGEIPNEMYLLTSLQTLALWGNRLSSSTISPHIGQLTNLRALAIGTAELSGTLPSELGLCTNMRALVLPTNELTGTLPAASFGELTNLEHLWLYENHLTGQLGTELGLLKRVKTLNLLVNDFEGTIPSEIGNLDNMTELNLHTIPLLEGTLPTELGRLTSLEVLYTYGNLLTGSMPSEMGLLESLYLWYGQECSLNGTLPSELGQIPFLSFLSLRNNQLSGTIPVELLSVPWGSWLYLQDNQLTGYIPDVGGNSSSPLNFGQLKLSGNRLIGTIPASTMARVPYLDELWLYDNKLSGQIPSEIGAMKYIYNLQLQDNDFSGSLPNELALLNTSRFVVFNISNNPLLMEEIPVELCLLEIDGILDFDCYNNLKEGLCGCNSCPCGMTVDITTGGAPIANPEIANDVRASTVDDAVDTVPEN